MMLNKNATAHWREVLPFFQSALFHDVQMAGLFSDSKTFADAIPKQSWQGIIEQYNAQKLSNGFSLSQFVDEHFVIPQPISLTCEAPALTPHAYIEQMWQTLAKNPDEHSADSLIPLPYEYIVPGGRFREIYYWDSYFTALGLVEAGRYDMATAMVKNFLYLIDEVGHIPNGNRAYYHTRSQPPILGMLAKLVEQHHADATLTEACLRGMEKEYQFWMRGADTLTDSYTANARVVRLDDGLYLNRYWDEDPSPRPESYREDIELANGMSDQDRRAFFRHIRAACESGWDFSSRWMTNPADLSSIRTTDILPVDLNALLFLLEKQLSCLHDRLGNAEQADYYAEQMQARQTAMNRYFWSPENGFYFDYDWLQQTRCNVYSVAAVLPLFVKQASAQQAESVKGYIAREFLHAGGVVTTLCDTYQQWDSPNGWAPLQWFASEGLVNYGFDTLSERIRRHWLEGIEHCFENHHTMLEKYNVVDFKQMASGGEYAVQLGFGWTNGVTRAFYTQQRQLSESN